jgi:hypothetical protein
VQAQTDAVTTPFDVDLIVTAAIAHAHGVLGTPRASLVIVRPTLVVRDARDGEEVTISRGERARLGRLYVRWGGCGEIELTDGTRVRGGIHIKKPSDSNWSWGKEDEDPPKVHICSTCVVDGELRFDRAVILHVEDGARIGKVIGDKVTRR